MKVKIGAGHPHAGECGSVADSKKSTEIEQMRGGRPCGGLLVQLNDCRHGVDCCYVFPGEFRVLA